jgi:sugar phosphate isomerase/epimerase
MLVATSMNVCLGRCTETELLPRLAAAGFDGLDFNFIDLLDRIDWRDRRLADAWVGDLAVAATAAGLKWVQSHGPMFNPLAQGDYVEKCRALCGPCITACGQLGVPWMVMHPGTAPGAWDRAHRRNVLERNLAFFQSLLPACEAANVGMAIENMQEFYASDGRQFGAVPEDLCELIDALNHPLVGACWDTGHAKLMKLEQRGAIASLGPRLKVVHIQENDGKGDDHMMPFVNGRAGIDWRAVTAGLHAAGFKGAFTFEFHNSFQAQPEELFDASLRYAAQVVGRLLARWTECGPAT